MAALIVETIWLVNGLKRHIVMAAPLTITAPSSVQSLMKSSLKTIRWKVEESEWSRLSYYLLVLFPIHDWIILQIY